MSSPYSNPNDPHDPNGISHWVVKADRNNVKLLYSVWLESWKNAYKNGTSYPPPFEYAGLYGGNILYDGTYVYDGSQTF